MVKRIGYIFALLLISITVWGEDSTYVFRVNSSELFLNPLYKETEKTINSLTKLINSHYDKIMSKEMAFAVTGEDEAAESVISYFVIYEGLKKESFTYYEDDENAAVVDGDYLVSVIFYKTGFEPDVIRRKKRKSLSMNKVDMVKPPVITIDRGQVQPWSEQFTPTQRPFFLIKTNLLNDAALTPNIEFDIPLAKHWSISAEYNYGWWLRRDNSFCWQIQYGGIDLKYWIKPSSQDYNSMDKWYVTLFYDLGIYDFQFNASNGTRGDFNVMAGASFGYVLPVNDYISFDLSFGAGFMSTVYQKYFTFENVIIKSGSAIKMNFPCPKAKVSLVFVIFKHVKKGGAA